MKRNITAPINVKVLNAFLHSLLLGYQYMHRVAILAKRVHRRMLGEQQIICRGLATALALYILLQQFFLVIPNFFVSAFTNIFKYYFHHDAKVMCSKILFF